MVKMLEAPVDSAGMAQGVQREKLFAIKRVGNK